MSNLIFLIVQILAMSVRALIDLAVDELVRRATGIAAEDAQGVHSCAYTRTMNYNINAYRWDRCALTGDRSLPEALGGERFALNSISAEVIEVVYIESSTTVVIRYRPSTNYTYDNIVGTDAALSRFPGYVGSIGHRSWFRSVK
jgi:hypothetical protein